MTHEMEKTRLPQNVADAVRERLPEEISITLRKRLEEADVALDENAQLKVTNAELMSQVEDDRVLKKREKNVKIGEQAVAEDMAALRELERDLKVKTAELELAAEKRISKTLKEVLLGLVRNTTYRESALGTEPDAGNQYGGTVSTSETRERTAE